MAFGNESCISGDTLSRRSLQRWKNGEKGVSKKTGAPRKASLNGGGESWSADLYACAVPHDSLWYYSGSVGAAARPSARLLLSEVSLICFHSSLSSPS